MMDDVLCMFATLTLVVARILVRCAHVSGCTLVVARWWFAARTLVSSGF